jgi:hypothetical protein
MATTVSSIVATTALFVAAFFALRAAAGVYNQFLRRLENLPLDRPDLLAIYADSRNTLLLLLVAIGFKTLSWPMALAAALMVVLVFQIFKILGLVRRLERLAAFRKR